MIYVHWIFFLIYAFFVLAAMIAVLMDNRQPSKTMAWILVLVFFPVIGIILYFFFGQNTRKEKLISQQSMDQLTKRSMLGFAEQQNLVLPDEHSVLIKLFTSQNWALPFKSNETDMYTDGYGFFHDLLRDIAKARHHIHLESYIICDDPLGYLVSDALIDKAKEGVEVRFIYDDVGCWNVPNAFFERMRNAGIDVHAFMPVKFPAFTSKVNYRNHRKLCVIDGKVGYIGGMNLALRYAKGGRGRDWCDTHLRVCGAVVSSLQRSFIDDWYLVDHSILRDDKYYPAPTVEPNDCLAQVVLSSPLLPWNGLMQGYVSLIYEARKYVYIETPYFIPPQPVLMALTTKALAGVDVCVMLPEHADRWFVEHAARSYIDRAHDAGVKFYLYQPGINHSKLLIIDDMVCSCGSTNIDFRSFENNCESNLFIYDTEMALRMKHLFLGDLAHCSPLDENYLFQHHTIHQRLADGVVRMFSPLM